MAARKKAGRTVQEQYREAVASYVAAGGDESVQRVITAVNSLSRKLDQWYTRQLADLDLSHGEWSVVAVLATSEGRPVTPSQLADASNVAASSMTHRLDKMTERGLVRRSPDPENRTRVLVELTTQGWELFEAAVREANVVESDVLAGLKREERDRLAALLEVVISGLDEIETA
ncbi:MULTISPECIES: MarR family winged helix-turn-helix transcriptional regulator [unclassified Phycicoccus]|uniref:MarR family winged helix-turn-helix transcriptional regulator n=1 Tax=unclassified Phycicoccus TaxID=2637926 RepID=UPI0007030E4D|nr:MULTISPECIES: MarR family transcriptional regulator [unclassified Phycicoccus]KQU66444.1 MarR family transcriptional regulator [Phycicoccus sp. Root101]KQZ87595.1 MarR family transcriptional regulator [Phycicoccus sp. Root563]